MYGALSDPVSDGFWKSKWFVEMNHCCYESPAREQNLTETQLIIFIAVNTLEIVEQNNAKLWAEFGWRRFVTLF